MKTDSQIQADILDELRSDVAIAPSDIAVTVRSGTVTLSGQVESLVTRNIAVRAAQRVAGVRAVADELRVHLPPDRRLSDEDIAHAVVNALMWDTEVPDKTIKARVHNGWIWLVGEADWRYQRDAAQRAVEHIAGVKGVSNIVRIRNREQPPVASVELKTQIEHALARNVAVTGRDIHVAVADHSVALSGRVHSWSERMAAERAAWSAAGITAVDNSLEIVA
ncbi:MAG TPA: BON domain-containing protein [Gemmatimonadaceae bacterium]